MSEGPESLPPGTHEQDAVAVHMEWVRALSRSGGPLSKDGATVTVNNPAWFERRGGRRQLTPARRAVHRRLVGETPTAAVDGRRLAIVMAGPPGAGKSTIRAPFMEQVGLDPSSFLVVDADAFKDSLIEQALVDGSYEGWIKPERVRELEAGGERFFPLEMSALLQRESSLLAMAQRGRAVEVGANIVLDGVLWDSVAAVELGQQLSEGGYTVSVLDVEVGFEVSQARIEHRWASAYREALAGGDSRGGGRWVPSEYARMVFDGPQGRAGPSRPEVAAAALARQCPAVMRYQVYRTSASGEQALSASAVLEVDLERRHVGARLTPRQGVGSGRSGAGQVAARSFPTSLTAPTGVQDANGVGAVGDAGAARRRAEGERTGRSPRST